MNIKTICLAVTSFTCVALFAAFETPQQAINASRQAIQSKNYEEAHKNLTEGYELAVNPTERILVLNQHANLYAMQKDWKNAEKMIMMIINDNTAAPDQKASAWLTIARFKENQRAFEDVVEAYQASFELHKEGNQAQEALNKCGMALIRLKDFTAAIECFKQVFSVPNKDLKRSNMMKLTAYNNIATAYIAMKQYPNAVKTLEDAAKLPEFKEAAEQTALKKTIFRIYEAQIKEAIRFKRFDEADEALNALKQRDDSKTIAALEVQILNGKAALENRKRNYAAAEDYYLQALKVTGATPDLLKGIYGEMIQFYLRDKKNAEAEKALQSLMAIPCKDAEEQFQTNFFNFRYLAAIGKMDEAVNVMEETAKLKGLRPARIARCYELICSTYLSKDLKTAKLYYEKAAAVPGANWTSAYLKKKLGL